MTSLRERDPFDVRLARDAPAPLRAFNDAGVISSADVQVARRLAALGGVEDPALLLALALAVRAPRLGHVLVDLATIRTTVAVDTEEPVDLDGLPWPDAEGWVARVAECALVAVGDGGGPADRPLRLVGTALYLDRYWREERQVAADLRARGADELTGVRLDVLAAGLRRLYGDEPGDARGPMAAAAAVLRRLSVVAGGPGTGKTSAVARIVALLVEQAAATGASAPLVALAAPTGKAAARLEEAVNHQAGTLDVDESVRRQLQSIPASTLHRLLGWRPDSRSRFRHHRGSRLPHDVIVVDETSMVSLTLMARLLEAVRPDARVVLVGDPDQLSSIEAGAVLGDVVGPATTRMLMRPASRARLADVTGADVPADPAAEDLAIGDGIVVLDRVFRFGGAIAAVADAVRRGDADAVVAALGAGADGVTWIPVDAAAEHRDATMAPVRDAAVVAGRAVIASARDGRAREALDALGTFRLLCAHRRGPYGVSTWMPAVQRWLAPEIAAAAGPARDYPGRPLLVTANDYDLNLFNGDTGVVVAMAGGRVMAAFERRGGVSLVRPNQLGSVETVYAMTVHKSQGSQFQTAAVVVPPATSRILTRELLYTAVTRARRQLIVVGTEDAIRAAVARPAARASGLRTRLWAT
ncbi:MAG TPA: exodeoxyribonuclease V subunit alpha [Baekduia sp.]|uniref:exodeoxyribonuclease V subunit alpha n=1 Tax=Baekduia sp. TaxID=2600305 RepID=UPI002C83B580|nr:exodeoxyribonuclease V subunit alpha [Baekduia sp.]HMJ36512.1 exodeoxyribonuclease V subunit alpha [Baekduia sp.]